MPLRLVLGPANARKVGRLLDAHAAASQAGSTAWFVVPSAADVEPFQRELAGLQAPPGQPPRAPVPFGQVMEGTGLIRHLLSRLGGGEMLLSRDHRRAVALAAIRDTHLESLAPAARSGWLADELIGLAEELSTTGDLAGAAEEGLRAWSSRTSDSRGQELADLLRADHALLRRLADDPLVRQVDRARAAAIVGDALQRHPSALADHHVVLSGFDDLDPVQRALVVALGRSEADVLVSLPYQAGREALTAARDLAESLATQAEVEELPSEAPSAAAVPALADLQQRLYEQAVFRAPGEAGGAPGSTEPFQPEPGEFTPAQASAQTEAVAPAASATDPYADDPAILELRGGGPDEEAALIAEHLAERVRRGVRPQDIAVAVGEPGRQGPAIEAALRRAGLPAHLVGTIESRVWPSVAALVALLTAVGDGGQARHLVDWVGGPGGPGRAEAFDAAVRRRGAASFWDAARVWSSLGHARLPEVDALREAQRPGAPAGSLERAAAAALRTRVGALLQTEAARTPTGERDLRAAAQVLRVLDGLVTLVAAAPALGLGLDQLITLIAELPSPPDLEPQGSIAVLSPLGIRTRYLEIVVVARMQRGSYPANEPIRRVLTRNDRSVLNTRHQWPVPARPEHAASERYLAYEVVARPTRQLVLAWHDGNGDGKPAEPSPLLAEVRRAAGGIVPVRTMPSGSAARHALGDDRLARILAARRGPRHREPIPEQSAVLAAQEREHYSVGALQTASRCAAQWFVDHHLRPKPLSPDAAPLTAGRLRHEVLAEVVRTVVATGEPVGPGALEPMRAVLDEAATRLAAIGASRRETLAERLMRERVVAEIGATLPALCGEAVLDHQPVEFELPFGTRPRGRPESDVAEADGEGQSAGDESADDLRPPITVERAGERLVLSGRIDRLDRSERSGELVVVDYKGANVEPYRGAGWVEARELQAGLYALVAERLLGEGSRAVASMYQPVPGPTGQLARGAADHELGGRGPLSQNDHLEPGEWDELLDALVQLAGEAQRVIDDGIVAPDPARCSPGGCRYPWLCREVRA